MKWIKSRKQFLNEAKIRDVIFPRQAKEVAKVWGEKFLDYEEVDPTPNIEQGKWKLSEEDKNKALGAFFGCDLQQIHNDLKSLPDKFGEILGQSLNLELLNEKQKIILKDLNIKSPTIDQLIFIFDSVFRKLAVSETNATEMIQKDESGRPIRDEDGNMLKIQKQAGDPVFTNNLVNINSFLDDYNRCYRDERVNSSVFDNRNFDQLRNLASIDENRDYVLADFDVFGKDLYISISHNPKDILNMSISKFYSSCQHLYGGGYRQQVLANVFDPNSIPAFLVFDTPLFWDNEKISDQLPLSRMILRNLESFDDSDDGSVKIFFDRAYPDRMRNIFMELVQKYTNNKRYEGDWGRYMFTPDVDVEDQLREPYMDMLGSAKRVPFIGKNIKSLYLSRSHDWSKTKISPKAQVKEIIIETTTLPEGFLDIKLNPDWIKFKFLKINSLNVFSNILTDSVGFDKCKLYPSILSELKDSKIKKLQFISCDIPGKLDLDNFENLEELQLIYSVEDINEVLSMKLDKLKKLIISGDLIRSKEDKIRIADLRKSGVKIEIVGPVI
jgi:hypothetical protein